MFGILVITKYHIIEQYSTNLLLLTAKLPTGFK